MKSKTKSIAVSGAAIVATALYLGFGSPSKYELFALLFSFGLCFWNFYAYGVDRGMWPRQFVELDGYGNGNATARSFVFWVTAVLYGSLLIIYVRGS